MTQEGARMTDNQSDCVVINPWSRGKGRPGMAGMAGMAATRSDLCE